MERSLSVEKTYFEPCPVWLGWLGIIPQSKRSWVQSQSGRMPGLWVESG